MTSIWNLGRDSLKINRLKAAKMYEFRIWIYENKNKKRIVSYWMSIERHGSDNKLATRASRRSQIRLFGKLNLSKSRAPTYLSRPFASRNSHIMSWPSCSRTLPYIAYLFAVGKASVAYRRVQVCVGVSEWLWACVSNKEPHGAYSDISFTGKKVFDKKDQADGWESKTYSISFGSREVN